MKKLFLLMILIFVSCSKKEPSSLKINIVNEISSLDPRKARELNSIVVMKMLYEGLTRVKNNGKIDLALAKKIDISSDKKTYVFHLKKTLWNNLEKITAYDFEYSLKQSLSPHFPSSMSYKLFIIKNAKEAKKGEVPIDAVGIKTDGPYKLIIELCHPVPYFLEIVSHPCFFPISKKLDQKNKDWANDEKIYVANGPFVIKEWKHRNKIELKKNKRYWDKKNVKLHGITLHMVSQETELKMFETKDLDWAGSPFSTLPIDALKTICKKKEFHKKNYLGTSFLRINTKWLLENFSSEEALLFRKNLNKTINKTAIAKHVLQGTQTKASFLIPPKMDISCSLKEVGPFKKYPFFSIKLMYSNSSYRNHLVAQTIQRDWEKNLKIKVHLEALESKIYFKKLYSGDYEIAMGCWIADCNDAMNFLDIFKFKNNGTNNTFWEDQEYITYLDHANRETNIFKRKKLLEHAQQVLMNNMPIIPIYHLNMLYLKNPKLKKNTLSEIGQIDFRWAYLEK